MGTKMGKGLASRHFKDCSKDLGNLKIIFFLFKKKKKT